MLPVIAYNATLILPTLSKLQVTSVPQVEAAFGFFALVGPEFYDREKFEESCGIGEIINLGVVHCWRASPCFYLNDTLMSKFSSLAGVEVSRDQVTAAVKMVFDKCKTLILEQRKQVNGE